MSVTNANEARISKLLDKGFSPEEAAYIVGVDAGLARSVQSRRDHPTLSPTSSRNFYGRTRREDDDR